MKRISSLIVLSLSSSALLAPGFVKAIDVGGTNIGIQPRLEVGAMYYDFTQGPVSVTNLSSFSAGNAQFGGNFTQSSLEYTSTMPTLGAGLTFFVDRFFLDLSAQKAYNGGDSDTVTASQYFQNIQNASGNSNLSAEVDYFGSGSNDYSSDFDRKEYAISIGYQITDQISLFGGYKHANTDFSNNGSGPFSMLFTRHSDPGSGVLQLDGYSRSSFDTEFKYDGPFLGISYGLTIDLGYFKGGLSFNFAAASLDGEVNVSNRRGDFYVAYINGEPVPVAPIRDYAGAFGSDLANFAAQTLQSQFQSSGDTLGLTFGVNWRGLTSVKNLTYTLAIVGYNYQFDADQAQYPDITETAVNFRAGVAYAF